MSRCDPDLTGSEHAPDVSARVCGVSCEAQRAPCRKGKNEAKGEAREAVEEGSSSLKSIDADRFVRLIHTLRLKFLRIGRAEPISEERSQQFANAVGQRMVDARMRRQHDTIPGRPDANAQVRVETPKNIFALAAYLIKDAPWDRAATVTR